MMTDADGALAAQFAETFDPTNTQDWADVLRRLPKARQRRPRWQLVLVALLVVMLLIATTALAFGDQLRHVFFGTPAPPLIQRVFVESNRDRARIESWERLHGKSGEPVGPKFDPARSRGVMAVHTRAGLLMLWTAPTVNGPRCWFVAFAGDQLHASPHGLTSCEPSHPRFAIDVSTGWTIEHPSVKELTGWVSSPSAVALKVRFRGKPVQRYPLVDGYVLAAVPRSWHSPWKMTALDKHGNPVSSFVEPRSR